MSIFRDIRIDVVRDDQLHWKGLATMTHIPTGTTVTYEESWCDCSGRNTAWLEMHRKLQDMLIRFPHTAAETY